MRRDPRMIITHSLTKGELRGREELRMADNECDFGRKYFDGFDHSSIANPVGRSDAVFKWVDSIIQRELTTRALGPWKDAEQLCRRIW
jgi:hypothetical protein